MPFIRQQVGGTSAQIRNYKGYDKQLVVNTGDHRLHVMDGSKSGGYGVVMQYDLPLGSDDIADGAITGDKLASGAITSDKIPNNAITTAKLANGAVTTPKLADDSVTSAKIADGAVETIDLADGSVTFPKLNSALVATVAQAKAGTATDKLVTPAGLKAVIDDIGEISYTLPAATENTLGGIKVGGGLVISSEGLLEVSGVNSAMIANGSIAANDLASGAITLPKLNSAVYASEAEATAGTNASKLITPATLAAVLDAFNPEGTPVVDSTNNRITIGNIQVYFGKVRNSTTVTWTVPFTNNQYFVFTQNRLENDVSSGGASAEGWYGGNSGFDRQTATGCRFNANHVEGDGSENDGAVTVTDYCNYLVIGYFSAS